MSECELRANFSSDYKWSKSAFFNPKSKHTVKPKTKAVKQRRKANKLAAKQRRINFR